MVILSSSLSPPSPNPFSLTYQLPMAASRSPFPHPFVPFITAQQQRPTPTSKRSSKPTKILSPSPSLRSSTKTTTTTTSTDPPTSIPLKKVLVPIGYGSEEMEAVIMIDVLRRSGAEMVIASVEPQLEIKASAEF